MHKNFTRREFLKTTGAAVLAVAAAGALSACGGSGSSGYIPNPNPSTARTLGDLTFDVTGVGYSSSGDEQESKFSHIYMPVISIQNKSTSEIPLADITFSMCLKRPNSSDKAMYQGIYIDRDCTTELVSIPAKDSKKACVEFTHESTTFSSEIAYLTIQYKGKTLTYKIDGYVFSVEG